MKKKLMSLLLSFAMGLNTIAVMPINAFAVSGDSKIYEKEGYRITYSVGSEWDNNQTIEVKIENTGDEPILNWALKYDIDGTLSNVWNSKVFGSVDEYTVMKNNGYNYEIEPGQSVNYGYTLTSKTEEPAELPDDIEMYNRRIDVKSGFEAEFNVTSDWYTGFQAEVSIKNTSLEPIEAWTLSFDGNFDINNIWNAKLIANENRNYKVANQLWTTPINPGESASFGFTADKSATENATADDFQLTAVVIGESSLEKEPVIDYELDTDKDGLPDYYEEILGTDKNNTDTDSDGLSDGYEVFYLGTDPLKADSDDNGVNDGEEDFDNDGLTNAKENELGTDPNNADTDSDGLTDGDEINTYGTNPLKYDSDDDGISDGDEITLGLNPNSTAGDTSDSEKTFSQVVTAESEVLAAINDDEETPFNVSLKITAAGVAENNVYARESGYSNAIENSAIIGIAPEFVYTDGLKVEEVTVKFELDESIVNNTLGTYTAASGEFEGIKRLNVFMFFEEVNMLLPVETFHDEVTNTVYTTTDRMGTYCLMDMEIWLSNLGISPESTEVSEAMSAEKLDLESKLVYNENNLVKREFNTANDEDNANARKTNEFDVVFLVDQVNFNDSQLEVIKDKIIETSNAIWDRTPDASVVIYGYNGDGFSHFRKFDRAGSENTEALKVMLGKLVHVDGIDTVIISKAIEDLVAEYEIVNRRVYAFTFFDAVYDYTEISPNNSLEILNQIEGGIYEINISIALNVPIETKEDDKGNECYATRLYTQTDGIQIDTIHFVEKALEHIYGKRDNQHGAYNAIIATGYHTIVLDAPITSGYRDAARDVAANPQNLERYKKSGMVDTDEDGLLDFQEINFEICGKNGLLIQFDEDGYIKDLPLATVCSDLYINTKGKDEEKPLTYVEKGWKAFESSAYYDDLSEITILPIKSDPTSEDSDEDGINDILDGEALLSNKHYGIFINYINEQKIDFDDVISDGKVSICTIPITELGFEIGFESFACYDEYGDYYETDIFNKDKIINGYFDDWYIIAKNDNGNISYGVAYTTDCQNFVDNNSNPFKIFSKAIDSYVMSYETINNGYTEDGIWKASWETFTGRVSAYTESTVNDIGTLADSINDIRQFFSPQSSSSLYFSSSLKNDFSNQSYAAKWTYAYQEFEKKYLNSDSDTFMAAKTIGYTDQMMFDVGMMFVGGFVGTGGEVVVYSSVAAAPETLGTSLVIAIPAEAVAVAGAGVTATGTILLASDTNGYNQASQAMRDAEMLKEQPSSRKLRKNMNEKGITEPTYPHAAHHIVAGTSKKANDARAVIEKFGIGINDAENSFFFQRINPFLILLIIHQCTLINIMIKLMIYYQVLNQNKMLSIFLKMLHCNYKMELLLIKELYNLKIWKLWSYGEPYDDLEMVEPMTFEERQSFDGRSKINDWIPRKVQKMDSNSNRVLGDYSGYLFNAMTKRAVNILLPLMKENVEVLPLKCEYGEYYLINIITVLNCIDYEHAKYKMFSDQKRIMRFETYSFFEDKINQTHIFKIIDEPVRKPFVSDTFKNAVEEAGLTGFRFELVWDSKQVVY